MCVKFNSIIIELVDIGVTITSNDNDEMNRKKPAHHSLTV